MLNHQLNWGDDMLFSIALASSLIFSIIELRRVSPRISRLLFYISTGLVFIIVGLNRMNADYENYADSFYLGDDNQEIGFRIFSYLIKSINLPFETMVFLMGALLAAVLLLSVKSQYSNLIIFFYLLFPLALDLPQMRNTFMYLIVIISLLLFGHRNKLAFAFGIIIAAGMHMLGILYMPLAFLLKSSRKTFFKWIGILFGLLTIGAIGLRIVMSVMTLHPEIAEEIDSFEWFWFVIQAVQVGIDILTFYWIDRKIGSRLEHAEQPRMESLFRFGWYSLLYLPLVSLSTEMYRFRRNAQLVKYIYSAFALKYLNAKDKALLIGLVLLNIIFVIGMLSFTGDLAVYTVFDNNWLVRIFGR